jgi:hypothetical protein
MAPSVLAHMNSIFVANYAMSAAFNVLITGMIATKLFWHRRRMQLRSADVFDGAVGDVYISAIGVLAESAGLYCVAVISYVALFTRHSQEVYWFSAVLMSSSVSRQLLGESTKMLTRECPVLDSSVDHPSHIDGVHLHPKHPCIFLDGRSGVDGLC